ncbi:probable E3 ubiquitin-protein ligase HERC3 isoform X2 [Patella vulgata]|nr:probable E3 ubiquitin-protein ligase HERC3 isoform X2 [Patella vulgata]XP_055955242.1 probable E3 ubiquitin-protein ligase HERC3 isoform X2 [Patella vulgata]XP_055955243.1 probable E3 ubiquitin-protein ligase HERC3 isoform X2 [Patella vulgata]
MENLDDIDFQQIINVIFIGEEGVDAGGLTREFFSLLFKQTPVFENGGFNVNSQLLSDKIYQIIGKAASYSVLNGNQGPQCLRSHLVKYILSNVLPTDEEIPEEILPANVLYVLQEMGRLDNEGLNTLLTENADVFEAAGFRQKLHSGSKQSAALALHQHFGFYRFLPAMIQFIDGLKLHGVYDLLVKYPKESSLFLSIHETTYSDIIDMYQPSYSSDQEEKNIEEIIVYNLHQFLRKLQRGKITSEWISLNDITDVNTPVKLTIKDFLQAVTGSSSISNNIKIGLILFDHKSELLTTVNTCAPSITFSQTSSLKEYSFLEKSMINIIVGAYGFGIN